MIELYFEESGQMRAQKRPDLDRLVKAWIRRRAGIFADTNRICREKKYKKQSIPSSLTLTGRHRKRDQRARGLVVYVEGESYQKREHLNVGRNE